MNPNYAPGIVWGVVFLVLMVALIVSAWQKRRGGRTPGAGPGASGAIYDLLNQDKRNAIELIVEEKAGYRDPEDAEGKPTTDK